MLLSKLLLTCKAEGHTFSVKVSLTASPQLILIGGCKRQAKDQGLVYTNQGHPTGGLWAASGLQGANGRSAVLAWLPLPTLLKLLQQWQLGSLGQTASLEACANGILIKNLGLLLLEG